MWRLSFLSALISCKFVGEFYILHFRPFNTALRKYPLALQSTAGCVCIKNICMYQNILPRMQVCFDALVLDHSVLLLNVSASWYDFHWGICVLSAFVGTSGGFKLCMSYCVISTVLLLPPCLALCWYDGNWMLHMWLHHMYAMSAFLHVCG